MTRRDTVIKWLAYGVALILIAILNYYVIGPLPIALPLLLPMAAVAVGTLEGPLFGAGFGIAAGAVMFTVGHSSPLLLPILAAVGWLCGLMTQYVLRRDLVGHLLCAIITTVAWEAFEVGSRLLGGVAPIRTLLRVAGPELLWTLVFSFPVYWVGRFCCVHFGRIYHE